MFGRKYEEGNEDTPAPPPPKVEKVVETKPKVVAVDRSDRSAMVPITFLMRTAEYRVGQTGTFPMWEAQRIIDAGRAKFAAGIIWQK